MKIFSIRDESCSKEHLFGKTAAMIREYRSHRLACIPLLVAFVCLLAYLLILAYDDADRRARSDVVAINNAWSARLAEDFLIPIDKVLTDAASVLSTLDLGTLHTRLDEGLTIFDQLDPALTLTGFSVIDGGGDPLYSRRSENALNARPEGERGFWNLLASRKSSLATGRSVIMSESDDHVFLFLAMPVLSGERREVAWITTTLPIARLAAAGQGVTVGMSGATSIRLIDPAMEVFSSITDARPANEYSPDLIDSLAAMGDEHGIRIMNSDADSTRRLYGFQQVSSYPIIVVTGLALRDYLFSWIASLIATLLIACLIVAFQVSSTLSLKAARAREVQALRSLGDGESRTRLLIDSLGQMMFGLDESGQCTFVNAQASNFFGHTDPALLSQDAIDRHCVLEEARSVGLTSLVMSSVASGNAFYSDSALFTDAQGVAFLGQINAYPNSLDGKFLGAVVTVQDVTKRKEAEQRVSFLDFHDVLTGLPNRAFARQRFNQASTVCSAHMAFFYLDIDNFNTINDSLGHLTGDAVLKIIAKRLQSLQPDVEIVARLGGDEFLIVVKDSTASDLTILLESILEIVHYPMVVEGYRLSVTSSIGIAVHSQDGEDFGALLKAADTALFQAKAAGRNTWSFYTSEMGERGLRRMQIQMDLRQAFEDGHLTVFYQPQIDVITGEVVGAEALLRWRHPEKGPISPAEFIPAAESGGLIIAISNWVLKEVCQQLTKWKEEGLCVVPVAINCSAIQFRQGNLIEDVRRALINSKLDPRLLELELTESILIEDAEKVVEMIHQLKRLGIKLSIDDFGTGYSSMAYLKRFVVNKLKIDQSFINGVLSNDHDAAIVRTIINLAHSLGMTAIAEGVETREVLDALELMGCDQVQGYYFAKPVSAADFEVFIRSENCMARAELETAESSALGSFGGKCGRYA
jgi:diguanylate cyclase (GGDEF)-like protein/PAS domain S-box-containing protein